MVGLLKSTYTMILDPGKSRNKIKFFSSVLEEYVMMLKKKFVPLQVTCYWLEPHIIIIMNTWQLHSEVPPLISLLSTVRPWAAQTSQVHDFELGPKIFEMNKFMKWKPWAARFSDHLAVTLLCNKSCTNFGLHKFFLSPKFVHLKYFWTQFEIVHLRGPCSWRLCISRPYYTI